MSHCNESRLEALVDGRLDWRDHFACRLHLSACSECRKTLKKIRKDQRFVRELRQGVLAMEKAYVMVQTLEKSAGVQKSDNKTGERQDG